MKTLLVVLGLSLATAVTAGAQEPPQRPGPMAPGGPGDPMPNLEEGNLTPGEIQRLFDAYLVVEAQRALELSDQQYPQFISRLKVLQDTRRRNQQERNQLMALLQRLTAPRVKSVEPGVLEGHLKNLQELESRNAAEMRKAYNGLDEVLEVRQQARFRVLEEQIERRKIDLLMRARQQNRLNNPQGPNPKAPLRRPPPPFE